MGLIAKNKGGTDFEPITAGMHEAVCYAIVDLGTQPGGQFKPAEKVVFIFELPLERAEFEKDGVKKNLPRAISQRFTNSLSEKSNLRPFLESWRGRTFTAAELEGFQLKNVAGANCLLNIIHKAGEGRNVGKTFAEISSISPLLKTMQKRQPENALLIFDLDSCPPGPIREFPQAMPEWIRNAIMESAEYKERMNPTKPSGEFQGAGASAGAEEDVPF